MCDNKLNGAATSAGYGKVQHTKHYTLELSTAERAVRKYAY